MVYQEKLTQTKGLGQPGDKTQQPVLDQVEDSFGKGLAFGGSSYILWGLLPIYWKLLQQASSFEVFAHRMLWSFVFMFIICRLIMRIDIRGLLHDKRALIILGSAGLAVAGTWWLYIYAINNNHVLQASLGYYINPLVAILFGVVFFRERLTLLQKIATGLAAIGVVYFTIDYGSFPLVAIVLAVLFAIYGALKKKGGYPAVPALTVESMLLAPLALVFIVVTFLVPGRVFLAATNSYGLLLDGLLVVGGALTAIPLLLFARGANAIPLSWMGFLQYIAPTITLLLGVFVYGEPFTQAHLVCFALIWAGLILISAEMIAGLFKGRARG